MHRKVETCPFDVHGASCDSLLDTVGCSQQRRKALSKCHCVGLLGSHVVRCFSQTPDSGDPFLNLHLASLSQPLAREFLSQLSLEGWNSWDRPNTTHSALLSFVPGNTGAPPAGPSCFAADVKPWHCFLESGL